MQINLKTCSVILFSVSNYFFMVPAFSQNADLPLYKVGDSWTHKTMDGWTGRIQKISSQTVTGVSEIFIRVNDSTKTVNTANGTLSEPILTEFPQRVNFNFPYTVNGQVSFRINFDWPLTIGKKWTYEHETTKQDLISPIKIAYVFKYKTKAEVLDYEEIQVGGGKFKAFKVIHETEWKESVNNFGTQTIHYWYAPEIKRFVKFTSEIFSADGSPTNKEAMELLSYTLAP